MAGWLDRQGTPSDEWWSIVEELPPSPDEEAKHGSRKGFMPSLRSRKSSASVRSEEKPTIRYDWLAGPPKNSDHKWWSIGEDTQIPLRQVGSLDCRRSDMTGWLDRQGTPSNKWWMEKAKEREKGRKTKMIGRRRRRDRKGGQRVPKATTGSLSMPQTRREEAFLRSIVEDTKIPM